MKWLMAFGWRCVFRHRTSDGLKLSEINRGSICFAWHTSGLVDPLGIVMTHPHRFIGIGRHDLVSRPLIGWWVRNIGGQPIIRRREIDAKLIDESNAKRINDRSLATMSHALAGGAGAVIMPEGTSHLDPFIHRMRSGAFRIAANAVAIAKHRQLEAPIIQPVGIHYRNSTLFRSDIHIDYSEPPLKINSELSTADSARLVRGDWLEPPVSVVEQLRVDGEAALRRITPDAISWAEVNRWDVLATLEAAEQGQPLTDFASEITARHSVRDRIRSLPNRTTKHLVEAADEVANTLLSHKLDARSIQTGGLPSKKFWLFDALGAFFLLLISLPLTLPTSLIPLLIARKFGDNTDEGLDSRVTIHFIVASFKTFIFTPLVVLPFLIFTFINLGFTFLLAMIFSLLLLPLATVATHPADLLTIHAYDLFTDITTARRCNQLARGKSGADFEASLQNLCVSLNAIRTH
jgi:1-acyl-sn-glycerol-3-phosphate acyltransferase